MQPFAGRGRLLLLRHGETPWNREGRAMGRRPIPLSPEGEEQVRRLVPHLLALGIATIWTSPVARAQSTAEIVSAGLGGIAVRVDEGLSEVDYGAWEGRTFEDVLDEPLYQGLRVEPVETRYPDGESLADVRDRVLPAVERILAGAEEKPALVVSHGDPLRVVVASCLALDLRQMRRLRIDPGSLSAVELTGDWAEVQFLNFRPDPSL